MFALPPPGGAVKAEAFRAQAWRGQDRALRARSLGPPGPSRAYNQLSQSWRDSGINVACPHL